MSSARRSAARARVARLAAALLTPIAGAAALPAAAQQPPTALASFLQRDIGLTAEQVAGLERGQPVVKVLPTRNQRDVAVFGVIPVAVPRAALAERLRDFPRALRAPSRSRFGIFGNPATPADVAALQVTSRDVAELKKCRPGSCDLKIPATDMAQVRTEVNLQAPDAAAQVAAYARRRLVDYVTDYRRRGNEAMVVYADRGPVRSSDAFAELLAESPYIFRYAPSFHRYLMEYPRVKLDGAAEAIYWSRDEMSGVRPVTSVTHVVVYSPPELPGTTLIGGKQLFADHYFEAAFDLLTLVDRTGAGAPGVYALMLRRYRFDDLPSGGLLNIRGRVVGRLRDQTAADLRRLRETHEASSRAGGGTGR